MLRVRKAVHDDQVAIDGLLEELQLAHNALSQEEFWVGEINGEVMAIAQLTEVGEQRVLSSVGVRKAYRRRGVARQLLNTMLEQVDGEVYLFTLEPDIFAAIGFEPAKTPEAVARFRAHYNCDACHTHSCSCMRRIGGKSRQEFKTEPMGERCSESF